MGPGRAVQRARATRVGAAAEGAVLRLAPGFHERARRRIYEPAFLGNVFQVREKDRPRACLSYVPGAFIEPHDRRWLNHTNRWECLEIGRLLDQLDFVVDVADCLTEEFEPRAVYQLFIDAGYNLDRLGDRLGPSCTRVSYATGRHWLAQNSAELARLEYLRRRRGVVLLPRRSTRPVLTAETSDALLILGNEDVRDSYSHVRCPVFTIPNSFPAELIDDRPRDPEASRRTFLWLGSRGMVHKGLDLVLEVFSARPDLELHVIGPVQDEPDFAAAYEHELSACPNIHVHGFLDLDSPDFERIAGSCGALVYPSCSEAMSGAVLAAMAKGLIPVVSRETAADVEPAGLILAETTVETLAAAVERVAAMPARELADRSTAAREIIRTRHSRAAFSAAMEAALRAVARLEPNREPAETS